MQALINRIWYQKNQSWHWLLVPVSLVFGLIVFMRRQYLQRFRQKHYPVPVIVIGNLTVGGVGKTPLLIAMVKEALTRGYKPGIVSRGYAAQIKQFPHWVQAGDSAALVGDEPLLIRRKLDCPLVIDPNRCRAVEALLAQGQCDLIFSDDGLQHYALGRQIEIAVIDGQRGLGNGWLLPAGPLRENPARLQQVDFIIANAGDWPDASRMQTRYLACRSVATGAVIELQHLPQPITAIAGIGNPQRFFQALTAMSLSFSTKVFPDHYAYTADDLNDIKGTVLMTEKDAVKCTDFAGDNLYYLPIEAELPAPFWQAFWSRLNDVAPG